MRVLALQSDAKGHRTAGELLRRHLPDDIELDAVWLHDPAAESRVRAAAKLLGPRLGSGRVRAGDLDLAHFRMFLATAYLGRRALLRSVDPARHDALLVHTQELAWLTAGVLRRVPAVVSLDRSARQFRGEQHARWTHGPGVALEDRVLDAAARITTWTRHARDRLVDERPELAAKVEVVPPGVDVAAIGPPPDRSGRDGPVRLLFVGGDWERKGGPELLEAFTARVAGRAVLDLVTPAEVDAPPGVTIHRGVSAYSDAWFALFRAADVLVLPSRADASPSTVPEAMAFGLPVVSTTVGGIPELAAAGALLVGRQDVRALGDALDALVGDAALRGRLGGAGRAHAARELDAAVTSARMAELLREAGGRPG